mmetsp:Transcript_89497/g.252111  ORF Transcript_89497/g.252111 Transcript_89497/m.252111 type:complete len:211 (+) Transcript_89497:1181-1813(+)
MFVARRPHRKIWSGSAGSHEGLSSSSAIRAASCGQPTASTTAELKEHDTMTSNAASARDLKSLGPHISGTTWESSSGTTEAAALPDADTTACTNWSADNFSGGELASKTPFKAVKSSSLLATASAVSSFAKATRARTSHDMLRTTSVSSLPPVPLFCVRPKRVTTAPPRTAESWHRRYPFGFSFGFSSSFISSSQVFTPKRVSRIFWTAS